MRRASAIVLAGVLLSAPLISSRPGPAVPTPRRSRRRSSTSRPIRISAASPRARATTGCSSSSSRSSRTARSCATVVAVSGFGLFGPPSFADDAGSLAGSTLHPYEPVSQTTVEPSAANGYTLTVETVVSLPGTGLLLRQTDTYVDGQNSVRTSVRVENAAAVARDVVVYRTGDCFPGSDPGFGLARGHSVGCEQAVQDGLNAVRVAGPVYMRWDPLLGVSHFHVGAVADLRAAIGAGGPLADTCDCSKDQDIEAALSWSLHLGSGATQTVAHRLTYSDGAGRLAVKMVANAAFKKGATRFRATVTWAGYTIVGAPIDFVVGSLTACTGVTNSSGTASCVDPGRVPEFVARYRGDTTFKPANAAFTPKRPPRPAPDPPGFPACAHFDRTGVALVTGGDTHSITVFSTTEAPPCPIVQYTAYGDGIEIGAMRGDLRATDLFGSPVPGMAVLYIDSPFGSFGATCIFLTATDSRTGELLDTYAGSRDDQQCIDAVGGRSTR